jgi:hypothetical protein
MPKRISNDDESICENCCIRTATQETDDMVPLCSQCYDAISKEDARIFNQAKALVFSLANKGSLSCEEEALGIALNAFIVGAERG